MSDNKCVHRWSRDEDFRMNRQMCGEEIAAIHCDHCEARAWMTVPQWNAHQASR